MSSEVDDAWRVEMVREGEGIDPAAGSPSAGDGHRCRSVGVQGLPGCRSSVYRRPGGVAFGPLEHGSIGAPGQIGLILERANCSQAPRLSPKTTIRGRSPAGTWQPPAYGFVSRPSIRPRSFGGRRRRTSSSGGSSIAWRSWPRRCRRCTQWYRLRRDHALFPNLRLVPTAI